MREIDPRTIPRVRQDYRNPRGWPTRAAIDRRRSVVRYSQGIDLIVCKMITCREICTEHDAWVWFQRSPSNLRGWSLETRVHGAWTLLPYFHFIAIHFGVWSLNPIHFGAWSLNPNFMVHGAWILFYGIWGLFYFWDWYSFHFFRAKLCFHFRFEGLW